MKIQKARREHLYKSGKPHIREFVRDDIRWLWTAAQKAGNQMEPQEFQLYAEAILKQSDRQWMLEDRNAMFMSGWGPVGLVMATFDGWSLAPHVEWFPWTTTRNKLRASVGFLQTMRYAREIGSIKIFTVGDANKRWFKWLKRYVPIAYAGTIPGGRAGGENEYIFYLRGRKHGGRSQQHLRSGDRRRGVERQQSEHEQKLPGGHPPTPGSIPEHQHVGRELHTHQ